MKRRKILGISLIVTLTLGAALYLEACKKELVTPINNKPAQGEEYHDYTDNARTIASQINKFKRQIADKENVMRSGQCMPIDSVIWNVEALFNAEYAFSERKYLETVKQELEFFVDVNGNNEAPLSVVADLYDEITEAVRQAYAGDGISTDKSLMAVVVDKGETVGNRVEIDICVISGRYESDNTVKDPVQGPFGPGDCWYFGEYGGSCDDPSVFCDAAEIIEDTINYYYRAEHVPQAGFRRLNVGLFRIAIDGNEYLDENGEPYLYFHYLNDNTPMYLDYEMLNYYYTRELEVLLHILPSDPRYQAYMPKDPAFVEVDIVGLLDYIGNGTCCHHKNYVVYGNKVAIPSQELPPLRDLLN